MFGFVPVWHVGSSYVMAVGVLHCLALSGRVRNGKERFGKSV